MNTRTIKIERNTEYVMNYVNLHQKQSILGVFTFLVALTFLLFSGSTLAGENMKDENTSNNVIWIDVRTAEEYAGGYYSDAINIPYDVIADNIDSVTMDKGTDIRVYCRTGRRSGIARDVLASMGYTNVINEGGYEDLLKQ
ncbi:rhodanese-like domain-containing protein [Teredinibacter purpureus]|uniref:rhodanese-like domain-containing protein n=1 Tax=Teredinibacter purpureus TaxID=2731756 RepID=UPI001F19094A|nr:rhodanese-like domain-containing protein [Teredinibacter purpureus]